MSNNNTGTIIDAQGRTAFSTSHAKVVVYEKNKTVYDQLSFMMGTLAWSVSNPSSFTQNSFYVDVPLGELRTIEFYCLEDASKPTENVVCMKTMVGLGMICKLDTSSPRAISVSQASISTGTRYTYTIPTIANNTKNIPLYAITYPVKM